MRIKIVICVAILLGICSILLGVAFYQTSFLHMESVQSAESRYIRYDGNCVKQLTDEEIAVLKLIFNNII